MIKGSKFAKESLLCWRLKNKSKKKRPKERKIRMTKRDKKKIDRKRRAKKVMPRSKGHNSMRQA